MKKMLGYASCLELTKLCRFHHIIQRKWESLIIKHNMNIGNAYRRARNALCFMRNMLNESQEELPLETKNTQNHESRRLGTIKILVPDSCTGFSHSVPANINRSVTLIENPSNCKQNVYFCLVWRQRIECCTIELAIELAKAFGRRCMWLAAASSVEP